jgi:hypothetical protein
MRKPRVDASVKRVLELGRCLFAKAASQQKFRQVQLNLDVSRMRL